MKANFDTSLRAVLQHEGGYVNNPKDPGGPTNKGITIATARLYISPTYSVTQLRNMMNGEAAIVYRRQYADKVNFDDLPAGLDYAAFDYAVNSGPGRPQIVLRRLIGLPDAKGAFDPRAISGMLARNPIALINALCDERLKFLQGLRTWSTFGKGWARRVAEVRAQAIKMSAVNAGATGINGSVLPTPAAEPVEPAQGKAVPSPAKDAVTPAGGALAGTAAAAGAAQATFHFPTWGVVALAIGALVVAIVVVGVIIENREKESDKPAPGTKPIPLY